MHVIFNFYSDTYALDMLSFLLIVFKRIILKKYMYLPTDSNSLNSLSRTGSRFTHS